MGVGLVMNTSFTNKEYHYSQSVLKKKAIVMLQ